MVSENFVLLTVTKFLERRVIFNWREKGVSRHLGRYLGWADPVEWKKLQELRKMICKILPDMK
jgi:hypothetical protein